MKAAQQKTPVKSAVAALLILLKCSVAMATYPMMKIVQIIISILLDSRSFSVKQ